jgi:flagellar biosynthesis protein FlhF
MIIKSFTGPNVAAALKMVRDEMGGNAVVLKTRELPAGEAAASGKRIEVTACIDEAILPPGKISDILKNEAEVPAKPPAVLKKGMADKIVGTVNDPSDFALNLEQKLDSILDNHSQTERPDNIPQELRSVYHRLLDADIPVEITGQLIEKMGEKATGPNAVNAAENVINEYLDRRIRANVDFKQGMKVVFVGLGGAGKTSALAKLAARLVTENRLKVTLSTLDDIKVSSYEEIGSYADILDLPVSMYEGLTDNCKDDSVVLIDTPPLSYNTERRQVLINKIKAVGPDIIFLVYSVCNRSRDLMDAINLFESVSPDYLIASHLDETERWGGVFAMTGFLEIPLAFTTSSPGGFGQLEIADKERITRQVLNMEVPYVNKK